MSWLATRVDSLVRQLEREHHFPWVESAGCCTVEIENASLTTYDWQRFGVEDFVENPAQANLLLVAGWINPDRAEKIKQVYEQMQRPRSVIAVGACAFTGSPYTLGRPLGTVDAPVKNLLLTQDVVPVDIYVPGCPPRPEAILSAILELQRKLKPGRSSQEVLREALNRQTR